MGERIYGQLTEFEFTYPGLASSSSDHLSSRMFVGKSPILSEALIDRGSV